jgi:hypothetical protein
MGAAPHYARLPLPSDADKDLPAVEPVAEGPEDAEDEGAEQGVRPLLRFN